MSKRICQKESQNFMPADVTAHGGVILLLYTSKQDYTASGGRLPRDPLITQC